MIIPAHTVLSSGARKDINSGGSGLGFRNRTVIPRFIKGLVKAMYLALACVIVNPVIAMSTF